MTFFLSSYRNNPTREFFLARVRFSNDCMEEDLQSGLNIAYVNVPGKTVTFYPWNETYSIAESELTKWESLNEYDGISIENTGICYCFYDAVAGDPVIVTGLACNTNCIMCPVNEQARDHAPTSTAEDIIQQLQYFGTNIHHMTITGGEPTLMMMDLPKVIEAVHEHCPLADILILTNGRTFSVSAYADMFNNLLRKQDQIAIPIHGSTAELHDHITQAPGSFLQTVNGLRNLSHGVMQIEIRIVVSKLNYQDIDNIADVVLQLPRVSLVNFIALEMCGNAIMNRDKVWIDYPLAAKSCETGIEKLVHAGIDVGLYNFPRCVVDRKYWSLCKDSISDYKIRFAPECDQCKVKPVCGGVFNSTLSTGCFKARPILENS